MSGNGNHGAEQKAARFWTAPALWRFWLSLRIQSARGLAQSKTLSRLPNAPFAMSRF